MNFKFRNLLLAGAVIFGMASCSNDNDSATPTLKESYLTVSVTIPGMKSSTRANQIEGMDNPVEGEEALTPKADKVRVSVMKGSIEEKFKDTTIELDGSAKVKFDNIMLDGSEKVRIVAYKDVADNYKSGDDLKNISIKSVQHNADNIGIHRAIYTGEKGLTGTANKENGKEVYTVEVEATSIVARTEVSGGIQFNKELVQSVTLDKVTPLEYKETYLGKTVDNPNDAVLDYILEDGDYANILNGDDGKPKQVVAHHVFDKNAPKLSIGMKAFLYDAHTTKNAEGKEVYTKIETEKDGQEIKSYVYNIAEKGAEASYAVKAPNDDYYAITFNDEGLYTIGEKIADAPTLQVKEAITPHFTLVIDKVTEGTSDIKNGLEGGNIYAIDLEKGITWNDIEGHENEYSPDENIGGEEHETNKESVIYVTATVKKWTRNKVHVSVN